MSKGWPRQAAADLIFTFSQDDQERIDGKANRKRVEIQLGKRPKRFLQFSSVQLLSHVQLSVTPWSAACQASLSITSFQSLLKLMSIESVMPCNHLILCRPLLPPSVLPSIKVFPMSQFFAWGGQNRGVSASASVLPMNTQDWSPLGWTNWISLQSKGLSRVLQHHSSKASILQRSTFFIV